MISLRLSRPCDCSQLRNGIQYSSSNPTSPVQGLLLALPASPLQRLGRGFSLVLNDPVEDRDLAREPAHLTCGSFGQLAGFAGFARCGFHGDDARVGGSRGDLDGPLRELLGGVDAEPPAQPTTQTAQGLLLREAAAGSTSIDEAVTSAKAGVAL